MNKKRFLAKLATVMMVITLVLTAVPMAAVKAAPSKNPAQPYFSDNRVVMNVWQPYPFDTPSDVCYGTYRYYYINQSYTDYYWDIKETWKDKETGVILGDGDSFKPGKTYIYTVEASSAKYDFSARAGIGFAFKDGDVVWNSEPGKAEFPKSTSGWYLMVLTAETTVKDFSLGSYTFNLEKGSFFTSDTDMIGTFYNFYNGCVEDNSIDVNEKSLTDVDVDLDKDGHMDLNILLHLTSSLKFIDMTLTPLSTTNIKTSKEISLSDKCQNARQKSRKNFYAKVGFVFGKDEVKAPTVEEPATEHKAGDIVNEGGAEYKITSVEDGKQAVTFNKPESATVTKATIPETITIDNKEFKVTEIAAGAFKGNKKIKTVTIGKYIVKIGSKAFFGCKNLKSIKIKTTSLTKKSVGGSAFKGISAKAKVKVPKKKLADYKKILKSKGIKGKNQKITK